MNQLIQIQLASWFGCGNDLFVYYELANPAGSIWGAFTDPTVSAQKYSALKTVADTPLANYTRCSNTVSSFLAP
jgi:hypothetical protein